MYPHEPIPDGAVMAPHHYTYGLLLAALLVGVVWDNYPDREPLLAVLGAGTGLFGFLFVWPWYPAAGASLTLAGPVITIAAVLLGWSGTAVGGVWDDYPIRYRVGVVLFSLVALDDAAEHAFGVWTPLDALWNGGLYEHASTVSLGLLGTLVAGAAVYAVWAEQQG